MRTLARLSLVISSSLVAASWALAQTPAYPSGSMSSTSSAQPADNSKRNKDTDNRARTADDQKNDSTDLALTQRIRKSVIGDKKLSTYAHNVKIVATDGTVTLTGVVRSEQEKMSVAQKAEAVAGPGHVVDNVTIKPVSK